MIRNTKIVLFIIIAMLLFLTINTQIIAASEESTTITDFYNSVKSNDGYITCNITITENQSDNYNLEIIFKENIKGINIGFYVTPDILNFMDAAGIDYNSVFEDDYMYTVGTAKFDTLDEVGDALSMLPFLEMSAVGNTFYAQYDLTIWDDIRNSDNYINDIYSTNKFIISFEPQKYLDTNSTKFDNGMYIWKIKDSDVTGIYAKESRNYTGFIVVGVGLILLIIGLLFILKNPFKNKQYPKPPKTKKTKYPKKPYKPSNKRKTYDDYGYCDDDYCDSTNDNCNNNNFPNNNYFKR